MSSRRPLLTPLLARLDFFCTARSWRSGVLFRPVLSSFLFTQVPLTAASRGRFSKPNNPTQPKNRTKFTTTTTFCSYVAPNPNATRSQQAFRAFLNDFNRPHLGNAGETIPSPSPALDFISPTGTATAVPIAQEEPSEYRPHSTTTTTNTHSNTKYYKDSINHDKKSSNSDKSSTPTNKNSNQKNKRLRKPHMNNQPFPSLGTALQEEAQRILSHSRAQSEHVVVRRALVTLQSIVQECETRSRAAAVDATLPFQFNHVAHRFAVVTRTEEALRRLNVATLLRLASDGRAGRRLLLAMFHTTARLLKLLQKPIPRHNNQRNPKHKNSTGVWMGPEASAETSALRAALRAALRGFLEGRVIPSSPSTSFSFSVLSPRMLGRLFHAALLLPAAESPVVSTAAEPNHSSAVPVEVWCLQRLLSSDTPLYHPCPKEDGNNKHKTNHTNKKDNEARNDDQRGSRAASRLSLSPASHIHILRCCMTTTLTPQSNAAASSGGTVDRCALRIPFGLGQAYARWLLDRLSFSQDGDIKDDQNNPHKREPCDTFHPAASLEPGALATLCAAILFFELYSAAALSVLISAAPVCVDAVGTLQAAEVSALLLAYATLGFRGELPDRSENFYLVLGSRAGQLADRMTPADVSRVTRAMELAKLPHADLKAALESSLRLRSLRRRAPFELG